MLVACRLAGLSALILDYAVKVAPAQCGPGRPFAIRHCGGTGGRWPGVSGRLKAFPPGARQSVHGRFWRRSPIGRCGQFNERWSRSAERTKTLWPVAALKCEEAAELAGISQ